MYIVKKNNNKTKAPATIMGYPIVKEYKYLGIWFDNRMSFDKHYEEIKIKVEKGMKIVNVLKWKKAST